MFLLGYRYSPLVVEDPVVGDVCLPPSAVLVELVGETKERIWCEFMP